ncbi:MAG: DUF934 domain-containing protein [Cypionkella sp.]|uniref:DUF934 domain-containing protein n=1 Tax=Cypionkella sp. TaxID=2811411 RepID=UPI002ABD0C8A|nr:DUF934 domain-containing protein [Cypionkella sp.]MDZ4309185.1 DUF934 domain-containing protein [Cypionkella sp.]
MSVLVTDQGFSPAPQVNAVALADIASHQGTVDLLHTDVPEALLPYLADLTLIRIAFPAFSDGRAFTIGHRLRALGYKGHLRAMGPVIADQYPMARRTGFDDVEIPDEMAARQPEAQWKFRADWKAHDYQSRLRA